MTSTSETVAESFAKETRTRRKRIAGSLWPRARLVFEILYYEVERDHVFTQASALTYKTLFSLLPVFVLSLMILSIISAGNGNSKLEESIQNRVFDQMGLSSLTINTTSIPSAGAAGTAPATSAPASAPSTQTFAQLVRPFVAEARGQISSTATGLVAFAVLLYGAISLMIVIEETFNLVWGSVRSRSWPRRLMLYWCVLTFGPIGVAGSIILGQTAHDMVQNATVLSGVVWLLSYVTAISGFFISWAVILLLYIVVPDTRIRWRAAALGSFLAAVAWELGKWGFGMYVRHAAGHSWYGSLALLPLFMLWIYITWSVVLMGLEFTYVQQYWPLLKRQYFFSRCAGGRGSLSDLRWVLSLGVLIYKQFKQGKTTEVDQAAELLMLPNDVASRLLDGLRAAGLVHEVQEGAYALARPPESITAHDLLTAARALCQVPPELAKEVMHTPTYPSSTAIQELEQMESTWAKSHALPSLAGELEQVS
jgi:YihY family inner membrane protein